MRQTVGKPQSQNYMTTPKGRASDLKKEYNNFSNDVIPEVHSEMVDIQSQLRNLESQNKQNKQDMQNMMQMIN
jgi:hypothetical protein